jgi:hypothetical protein
VACSLPGLWVVEVIDADPQARDEAAPVKVVGGMSGADGSA